MGIRLHYTLDAGRSCAFTLYAFRGSTNALPSRHTTWLLPGFLLYLAATCGVPAIESDRGAIPEPPAPASPSSSPPSRAVSSVGIVASLPVSLRGNRLPNHNPEFQLPRPPPSEPPEPSVRQCSVARFVQHRRSPELSREYSIYRYTIYRTLRPAGKRQTAPRYASSTRAGRSEQVPGRRPGSRLDGGPPEGFAESWG